MVLKLILLLDMILVVLRFLVILRFFVILGFLVILDFLLILGILALFVLLLLLLILLIFVFLEDLLLLVLVFLLGFFLIFDVVFLGRPRRLCTGCRSSLRLWVLGSRCHVALRGWQKFSALRGRGIQVRAAQSKIPAPTGIAISARGQYVSSPVRQGLGHNLNGKSMIGLLLIAVARSRLAAAE